MALTQIKLGGLAAESVDSDAYVDGSIDLAHLSADSVDSTQYVDGSIDNAHLADDAVDSDELAAGSVDAAHLAAGVGGISHDGSTADGVLTYKDADEATVESNLTFDGTNLLLVASGADIQLGSSHSSQSKLIFHDGGDGNDMVFIHSIGTDYMSFTTSNDKTIHWDGDAGAFFPAVTDAYDLGRGDAYYWDDVYATNGTIQTSDEKRKENISDSSLGLGFLNQLTPRQYKFKGYTVPEVLYEEGDNIGEGKSVGDVRTEAIDKIFTRTHYGLIAQEVEQVLEDNGMTTTDFAPIIKTELDDGDYTYGMRYAEYVGILIKAVQELSTKVETLENAT